MWIIKPGENILIEYNSATEYTVLVSATLLVDNTPYHLSLFDTSGRVSVGTWFSVCIWHWQKLNKNIKTLDIKGLD